MYAICVCILYPGTIVIICSGSKGQAGLIISEKIRGFFVEVSPNFAREIKKIITNNHDWLVEFHNGSRIKVVPATDLARGNRSNLNIYEEFRIIDKEVIDTVLSPFLISRQPPYLLQEKYKHLREEPKEMYISSAYYKVEWWFDELRSIVKMNFKGKNSRFIAFDYLLAVYHGLKTKKQMEKEREKTDEISFMMEYENIPYGENSNSYFKLDMFRKNRNIKKVFYPLRYDNLDKIKNPNGIKRVDGEIRIVSVDLAARKGKANDNTVITCIRLIPTAKGYLRELVYMESCQGEHTGKQALRVKQIYHDFECDYVVLDLQNVGINVFEALAVITKDEERGIEYDAMTVFEHKSLEKSLIDELKEKTLAMNAKPVIYPIMAYAKLNSDIAVEFRDKLQKNMISIPIPEVDAEDYLNGKVKEYMNTTDVNIRTWYIHPYRQFSEMINETVNMEFSIVSGNIKLETIGSARKDRYTSASYGNYFASLLEQDLLKEKDNSDWSSYVIAGSRNSPW